MLHLVFPLSLNTFTGANRIDLSYQSFHSYDFFLSFHPAIMSSDKSKNSSQTDGKAAQSKKSEMGMMSYKVGISSTGYQDIFRLSYHR